MSYIENYSEARVPARMVYNTREQAMADILKWAKFSNVSISVWEYGILEDKVRNGKVIRRGPDYTSAIIDRLFFDIDCVDKDGNFKYKPYKSMIKLWKFAEENNFKRDVSFTGGGYQMTIGCNVKPEQYTPLIRKMCNDMNLVIDKISLADMRRVVGSYNHGKYSKSKRERFCIPIYEHEIELPFKRHVELSKNKRKGLRNRVKEYGHKYYNPKGIPESYQLKELEKDANFELDDGVDDILDYYGFGYNDLCSQMRKIIEQPHVGHKERLYLISYLKSIVGLTYGDCKLIIPKLLDGSHGYNTDGIHSLNEGQVRSVYSKDIMMSPKYLKMEGYCKPECNDCNKYLRYIVQ